MTRVLYEGIRRVRARYLFPLARWCNCPPPVVGEMRLADFAILTEGIDALAREG